MAIIGHTKYGPVQTFRAQERPEKYICACCVMHVGVPQKDERYCSTCRAELEKESKGEAQDKWNRSAESVSITWLERCRRAREELREIDRSFPGHLDSHAWRYLHEDGQDQDEIEAGAVAHEEARRAQ